MTAQKPLQPSDNIDRLCVKTNREKRHASIENCADAIIQSLEKYSKNTKKTNCSRQ